MNILNQICLILIIKDHNKKMFSRVDLDRRENKIY